MAFWNCTQAILLQAGVTFVRKRVERGEDEEITLELECLEVHHNTLQISWGGLECRTTQLVLF